MYLTYQGIRYPEKSRERQMVRCFVPIDVARLLERAPQLVAHAVNAFYYRDLEGMFACSRMDKFPPRPKPGTSGRSPMVMTMVRFTRCLYAQLACQKFFPPKCFELPQDTDPGFKAMETGMKLVSDTEVLWSVLSYELLRQACGFEILYFTEKKVSRTQENTSDTHLTYAFAADKEWKAHKAALTRLGYFGVSCSLIDDKWDLYPVLYHRMSWKGLKSINGKKHLQSRRT